MKGQLFIAIQYRLRPESMASHGGVTGCCPDFPAL
jgi:hypothetical protein